MKSASLCALGQSAPNPTLSTLNKFEQEYIDHIVSKKCVAGKCKKLISYEITEKCIGCGMCAKNCPANCIVGEKKSRHVIEQNKCLKCGHLFDECEIVSWQEDRGEFWGSPCTETMYGCPLCKGDYEKTKSCKVCGGDFLDEELTNDVCDECIEERKYDFDFCYSVADTKEIEINSLLASVLDNSQIETILYHYLKSGGNRIDCTAFIEEDRDLFAEKLTEEVGQ
jgi:ferredoxin